MAGPVGPVPPISSTLVVIAEGSHGRSSAELAGPFRARAAGDELAD